MSNYWYVKNYTPTPRINFESFISNAEKLLNDPFSKEQAPKYPLTNIGYIGNVLVFEIALAGFKKENISIGYVGNVITVNAKFDTDKSNETSENKCECKDTEINYIQKNISTKDVCRKFYLANEYLGGSVKWKYLNGLLTVAVYPNTVNNNIEPSSDDEELFETKCDCNCNCCKNDENVSETN